MIQVWIPWVMAMVCILLPLAKLSYSYAKLPKLSEPKSDPRHVAELEEELGIAPWDSERRQKLLGREICKDCGRPAGGHAHGYANLPPPGVSHKQISQPRIVRGVTGAFGLQGPVGPQGMTGQIGPPGITGIPGPTFTSVGRCENCLNPVFGYRGGYQVISYTPRFCNACQSSLNYTNVDPDKPTYSPSPMATTSEAIRALGDRIVVLETQVNLARMTQAARAMKAQMPPPPEYDPGEKGPGIVTPKISNRNSPW